MIKRYIIFLAFLSLLFIISGCGGGGDSAPPEAILTINPATVEITDGSLWDVHRQPFHITVISPQGVPLDDVELRISFVWASPDGRFDTLLFDYDCDLTPETPLAQLNDGNTPVNSPMTVTTDEDGSYIVNLDFLSGAIPDFDCDGVVDVPLAVLEWSGTLQVTSGSLFASADFEVKAPSEE